MRLQILVPQYKETDDVVKPLLDSIAIQQCIDFGKVGVLIMNDGSDTHLSEEFLKSYPFEIQYVLSDHTGLASTRQKLFEMSTGEYIMYCDADDMFFNACGLWIIFQEIEKGFDTLCSLFVEETRKEDGSVGFVNHDMDSTFVHGKVHRRQYLIDKNINWNTALPVHEDSYYNILCLHLSDHMKYCNTPFYLWKWRKESICRADPKYILKTYHYVIDSIEGVIEQFLARDMPLVAYAYVSYITSYVYYETNRPEWHEEENKEYLDMTEERFAEFFSKYGNAWDSLADELKQSTIDTVRKRYEEPSVSVEEWLSHIRRWHGYTKSK